MTHKDWPVSKRPRSDIPVVFISSTSDDLTKYREAARDAALAAKFHPEMMESFIVSGLSVETKSVESNE